MNTMSGNTIQYIIICKYYVYCPSKDNKYVHCYCYSNVCFVYACKYTFIAPNSVPQIISGSHTSESATSHDICDGTLFKNHPVFKENPKALQVILYYDEFTAVNPMSPTSRK